MSSGEDDEVMMEAVRPAALANALPSTMEVRLAGIRYAARDTHLFELERPDRGPLCAAEPGAHIDLHLPNGEIRQYSLTRCEPAPTSYTVGIKRDAAGRGGSRLIFDTLRVGQLLTISAPRNNFRLVENAEQVVLVAGGIGITPIRSMVQRLTEQARSFELHYCGRSRADMAFVDELSGVPGVRLHCDDENSGKFLDMAAVIAAAPSSAHFYCCGPAPMLSAFEKATAQLPSAKVHVEYFTAKNEKSLEGGYTVQLARSKRELVIPPGRTILQVLQDAGIDIPYSCEQGICGSCETRVLAGEPDHRDAILSDEERAANRTMMICCSGSKSDQLVLDI
jgi:ferredoxin-NADP reductase